MSKIYVGRLSTRTRERDLEDAFEKFGKILKTELKYGYAFLV
jgi:arginine/serine-rich splicing factor 7